MTVGHTRSLLLATLVGAFVGLLALGARAELKRGGSSPLGLAAAKGGARPIPCGQGASPIAVVVRLPSATDASGLRGAGFVLGDVRSVGSGRAVAVIAPKKRDGTSVSPSGLASTVPGAKGGYVMPQSSDPALKSCDYKLADRPSDQRFVSAAKTALTGAGLITSQQADDPGAMYLVSDDPIDPGEVIVTIDVPGSSVAVPGDVGRAYEEVPFEAFVGRTNTDVTEVARGPSA